MKKVADRLNILKMTKSERNIYQAYRNKTLKEHDYIVSAEEKGKEEGIEIGKVEDKAEGKAEGMKEAKITLAKKMLAKGKSIDEIIEFTELTLEEIKKL